MKSQGFAALLNSEGKGFLGCMVAIVVLAAMIFAGIKLGPLYYTNYQFEDDLKNLISEAGARYMDDAKIRAGVLDLARKNNVNLSADDAEANIKIQRFAGQVHVTVTYFEPVNLLILQKIMKFELKLSSFTAG